MGELLLLPLTFHDTPNKTQLFTTSTRSYETLFSTQERKNAEIPTL